MRSGGQGFYPVQCSHTPFRAYPLPVRVLAFRLKTSKKGIPLPSLCRCQQVTYWIREFLAYSREC
jgi:hypothetical protein